MCPKSDETERLFVAYPSDRRPESGISDAVGVCGTVCGTVAPRSRTWTRNRVTEP